MSALRAAVARCDAHEILQRAREALDAAPPASDASIEAAADTVNALRAAWSPAELEQAALALEGALAQRRLAEPGVRRSILGPVPAQVAPLVIQAELALATALQARGDHPGALGRLRLALDDLRSGPCESSEELQRKTILSAARSLELTGRSAEARAALESLRDEAVKGPVSTHLGEVAAVLLQRGPKGLEAYRGKYAGDAEHLERMKAVLAALPAARERLARSAGIDAADVPDVVLGVADTTPTTRASAALTHYDPRTPCFPPVIVFHSEALALGMSDVEQVLVHELSHAWLLVRAGLAYESLPDWLMEGVSEGLAEQTEVSLDNVIATAMLPQPKQRFERDFWKLRAPDFEPGACAKQARAGVGTALAPWLLEHGRADLQRLARELRAGKTGDEALELAAGTRADAFLAAARERLATLVESRSRAAVIAYGELEAAEARSREELLRAADRLLEGDPSRLVRGVALWRRGNALESLERFDEARLAYELLCDARLELPGFVQLARLGRARCTMAREELLEDARRELQSLRRDAVSPGIATWCEEALREVEARISGAGK